MPIRFAPLLHLGADGVTVDDDESVVAVVEQEWLADPAKVGLGLLLELNPGPDTGVDEQIIAKAATIREALEELDMLAREWRCGRAASAAPPSPASLARIDAVALETLHAAEPEPVGDQRVFTAEDAQQHLLMIAEQEDRSHAGPSIGPQPFDHLGRGGPRSIRSPTKTRRPFRTGRAFKSASIFARSRSSNSRRPWTSPTT